MNVWNLFQFQIVLIPVRPAIVLPGNPPALFQFPSILASFLTQEWGTEHGKFLNFKLSVADSVGCTYNKYSWFLIL